jgi:hypothetical protein|tara:strand:- start:1425 stop:1637 length:213 start_codon:yes stop_codon:yes gene_type:complete
MEKEYIRILAKDFPGQSYESFIGFVYGKLTQKIENCEGKEKNKYIKIRRRMHEYILSNRSSITKDLRKAK